MCCIIGQVWKWGVAAAAVLALVYCSVNVFLIWGDATIKLDGQRTAEWSDISTNTAIMAALAYIVTCGVLIVACISNWPALYAPFIVATLLLFGVLLYHGVFFLHEVPAETNQYVAIAIIAVTVVSIAVAVLTCLWKFYKMPRRIMRMRTRRAAAGSASPRRVHRAPTVMAPPLSLYYGDIAQDEYNYGKRRRGDMVEPVPIELLEKGERGLLASQKAQDIFIKSSNGFARRHRVVSSWGFPSWNFPPVTNIPPVSDEPYQDSSDDETTTGTGRTRTPPLNAK